MSDYNDLFDFTGPQLGLDAVEPEDPAFAFIPDQSGSWTEALSPSVGLIGGSTEEQLQTHGDFALAENAESLGRIQRLQNSQPHLVPKHACAVCLEPYQTDSALHRHAIEAQHQAYRCKCGTGFNRASALKRHIKTKDAPKTFACTLCYDKFTRKDKLKDHCRHYHKVSDQGLQFLLASQDVKPRAGVAPRLRQAPVPRVAASSGSPASPAHGPTHAPAGLFVGSLAASTDQQYAGIPACPSVTTGPPATTSALQVPNSFSVPTGQFAPSADAFAADSALVEDFSGMLDEFIGNDSSATGSDGFNF